jgi:hypothetical protein
VYLGHSLSIDLEPDLGGEAEEIYCHRGVRSGVLGKPVFIVTLVDCRVGLLAGAVFDAARGQR